MTDDALQATADAWDEAPDLDAPYEPWSPQVGQIAIYRFNPECPTGRPEQDGAVGKVVGRWEGAPDGHSYWFSPMASIGKIGYRVAAIELELLPPEPDAS